MVEVVLFFNLVISPSSPVVWVLYVGPTLCVHPLILSLRSYYDSLSGFYCRNTECVVRISGYPVVFLLRIKQSFYFRYVESSNSLLNLLTVY